jgi:hypothetical protein
VCVSDVVRMEMNQLVGHHMSEVIAYFVTVFTFVGYLISITKVI